jgi:transcriptional regulator with XRE-family HTH domain
MKVSHLRLLRKKAGYSQVEFSRLCGFQTNTLNDLENDKLGVDEETWNHILTILNQAEPLKKERKPKTRRTSVPADTTLISAA